MATDRLSSADQSALVFDAPEAPAHIVAIIWLDAAALLAGDGEAALRSVRRQVEERLDRLPRFRQVVQGDGGLFGRTRWVDAETFDIARHVTSATLPPPGTEGQLLELAARCFMEQLDRRRPLWELRVVRGLGDGRVAVLVKLHHAIADGPAAVRLLSAIFDAPQEAPTVERPAPSTPSARQRGRPASVLAAARGYAAAIAAMNSAPATSLNRPVGLGRRLALVRLSLDEARRVAHATSTTINDVFVTLAAVGAGEIIARHGETAPAGGILAGVFVGLRMARSELGNATGVMTIRVPVAERDPRAVLERVAASTAAAKARQPAAGISEVTYLVTRSGLGRTLYRHQRQVNIFTSNVMGPAGPLSLLGAKVLDVAAVTSLGGNVALSFAALSYAGRLDITIVGDATVCPEVDAAAGAMRAAWETLRGAAPTSPTAASNP